jgi:uncharacterized membrane protein
LSFLQIKKSVSFGDKGAIFRFLALNELIVSLMFSINSSFTFLDLDVHTNSSLLCDIFEIISSNTKVNLLELKIFIDNEYIRGSLDFLLTENHPQERKL